MSDKPLECTSCSKELEYGEPHNFYDCVQYLKEQLQAKDEQIAALVAAHVICEDVITRWPLTSMHTPEEDAALLAAQAAIKEATDGS